MAKQGKSDKGRKAPAEKRVAEVVRARPKERVRFHVRVRRLFWRGLGVLTLLVLAAVGIYAVVNPPITHTIWAERQRLGTVERDWVPMERIAPVMARSVVAAEDANYCLHWGFDVDAIRAALEDGAVRGASTLTQQTVKNVYLWQGRSWARKAIEALLTPAVEAIWSKRRILEVYLNVAEFGEGVFGVEAAARHHFGTTAAALTPGQAALLASVLPNPKERSAARPSAWLERRARAIRDGAATIEWDGRATCFGG